MLSANGRDCDFEDPCLNGGGCAHNCQAVGQQAICSCYEGKFLMMEISNTGHHPITCFFAKFRVRKNGKIWGDRQVMGDVLYKKL